MLIIKYLPCEKRITNSELRYKGQLSMASAKIGFFFKREYEVAHCL